MACHALDIEPFALFRAPFDERRRVVDLAAAFRQRLALLQRHQQRQIFARSAHEIAPGLQGRRAVLRGP
jgi:hypothetical protein